MSQTPDKLWLPQPDSAPSSRKRHVRTNQPPRGKEGLSNERRKVPQFIQYRPKIVCGSLLHQVFHVTSSNLAMARICYCVNYVSTNSSTHLKSKMHLSTLAKESERHSTQYFMTSSMNHFWLNGHSIIAIVCQWTLHRLTWYGNWMLGVKIALAGNRSPGLLH